MKNTLGGGDIVIPESLGVKEIATRAFAQNNDITSVVIPEGVEIIGESAKEKQVSSFRALLIRLVPRHLFPPGTGTLLPFGHFP